MSNKDMFNFFKVFHIFGTSLEDYISIKQCGNQAGKHQSSQIPSSKSLMRKWNWSCICKKKKTQTTIFKFETLINKFNPERPQFVVLPKTKDWRFAYIKKNPKRDWCPEQTNKHWKWKSARKFTQIWRSFCIILSRIWRWAKTGWSLTYKEIPAAGLLFYWECGSSPDSLRSFRPLDLSRRWVTTPSLFFPSDFC